MKKLILVLWACGLFACGGGSNPDRELRSAPGNLRKLGVLELEILSGADTLKFEAGSIAGTGVVRINDPLAKVESANNYELAFEIEDGGSVALLANGDRQLATGIEVGLARIPGQPASQVRARVGTDSLSLDEAFAKIDASAKIHLSFDLHNDHGENVHLVAWNEDTGEELVEDMLSGRGFGSHWGLRLQGARVSIVHRREPKDKH